MKAVILLGGLGTRLLPLTARTPKPLLPFLHRPFIAHQLDLLKKCGVREVVLALGHKAAHFRRYLGDGRRFGLRFRYSIEKKPLGTGGAIRQTLHFWDGPAFVLNGDIFARFNLPAMVLAHRRARAEGSIALVRVKDARAYGLVEAEKNGRLLGFREKPPRRVPGWVNAGAYLLSPGLIEGIPSGRAVSVEREVFPGLLRQGHRLQAFRHRGYWSDIGTLESYWSTQRDLLVRAVGDGRLPSN